MIVLYVILAILVLLALYFISTYNGLIRLRNRMKDQWAQIEVQLKRRADLIPNLVETVKGYVKHEKSTLEDVVKARNTYVTAQTPEEEMKAAGEVTKALNKLLALTENYPELKANENFMNLQNELKESEDKISITRQFYNDTVLSYNNKREVFPSSIVAGMFNFEAGKFFEASEEDKKTPQVKF